jgi:23S rRNA (pseudouridine1915-N3)-methyltransferase
MRIQLLFLGKTRRPEVRALLDDYVARLRRYAEIEIRELRADSGASMKRLEFNAGATLVLLDAEGKKLSSQQFAEWIGSCRDRGERELVFLCGTSTGFPESLARRATQRISLSPLTFSHELARVMLTEQIYRAFALLAGHPYPK